MNTKRIVMAWFIADMVVALLPPLYWAASGRSVKVLGMPLSITYFLLIAIFIGASVVFAYLFERRAGLLD